MLTDGSRTLDVFWVEHRGEDIYFGSSGTKSHFSYHRSGAFQYTRLDGVDLFGVEDSPAKLRGQQMLGVIPFFSSIEGIQGRPYRRKRSETVCFINVKSHVRGAVIMGLIKPQRLDVMNKVLDAHESLYGAVRQTVLMTEVVPWLYVGVLSGGPAKWLIDAMNQQSEDSK